MANELTMFNETISDPDVNETHGDIARTLPPLILAVKTMRTVCIPVIVAVGFCGNTLCLMVFSARSMKRSSCSVFLGSLAAVDNSFLLSLLLTWIDGELVPVITTDFSCQLLIYLTYTTSFLSVWFIVGFTCERYIAICFPLKRNLMCSVKREKIVVICLTLIAGVIYNFSFWTSGMQQFGPKRKCVMNIEYMYFLNIVTWIDTFLTMVIPFFIIVTVNSLVLKTILQCPVKKTAPKETDKLLSSKSKERLMFWKGKSNNKVETKLVIKPTKHRKHFFKASSPQIRVTRTLLLVSMTFLCLNLPSHAIRLYSLIASLVSEEPTTTEELFFLQELTLMFYYATFSCNFVLYTLFGRNFKKALMLILRCRSTTEDRRRKMLRRLSSNTNSCITSV